MCNGGAMQYIQYINIYFMYVCMNVCEKYIKSISYKTTVAFRLHVVLHHLVSWLDDDKQELRNFYEKFM